MQVALNKIFHKLRLFSTNFVVAVVRSYNDSRLLLTLFERTTTMIGHNDNISY